jgi:tetratricopeptide (TPR) repeat protein
LAPAQQKAASNAWGAARRGDQRAVDKQLAGLPADHPVRALIALEARFVAGEAVGAAAVDLASRNDGYLAAWMLAALAEEREGRTESALLAARRAHSLRPGDDSQRLVERLEAQVVSAGDRDASVLLARGDAAGALAAARHVLELVPGSDDTRLIAARAALGAGQTAQAAAMLPALPDTPAGLEVKGKVAEALGQWDLAQQFYQKLPENYPNRCELLAEARDQARLSLAPPQVSRALASTAVTRRQLAAILIWEAPFLVDRTSGPVPVFEDVVGLPEGRDIVVAVRAGVLTGDSIARRFRPNRPVPQADLLDCLQRLAGVAGRPAPHFCGDGESGTDCLARPATLDGRTVAGLVRAAAGQEESPCSRR